MHTCTDFFIFFIIKIEYVFLWRNLVSLIFIYSNQISWIRQKYIFEESSDQINLNSSKNFKPCCLLKPKAYNKYKITVENIGVNITHIYDSEDNFFTINTKRNLFKPYHITIWYVLFATAIGRRLKALDVRTDPQTRLNWWWKKK
jgi:hypothetical protein